MSRLSGWRPVATGSAGSVLVARAGGLQRAAGALSSVSAGLGGAWSGAAAQAATGHTRRRAGEVDQLAVAVHAAGQALIRAGTAIGQAQTDLRAALAAAATAQCSVSDDGTVSPPARPAMPAGLADDQRQDWQDEADQTARHNATVAAHLQDQIQAALTAAGTADTAAHNALSAIDPPAVSPPPTLTAVGPFGGVWGPMPLPSCPAAPTPPPQPPAEQDDGGGFWNNLGHGVLDVAGLVPVLGEPADGINAAWYGAEGDELNAALSAAGMIPFAGWGATAAKIGIKGADAARTTAKAAPDLPARRFITTPRGTTFDAPAGWVSREADNGKGIVVQRPGAVGNADSIRIMEPTAQYPNGYFRYYNSSGQPLDMHGKPGSKADTHIPEDFHGRIPGWPE